MTITLTDESATLECGRALAARLHAGDIVALYGDLGAGKSTLARGILAGLGHADDVPSPTFPLVIPYDVPSVRLPVWHVDLYRLDGPEELEPLALDDALHDGALIIEWPERMGHRLWPEALRLTLSLRSDGGRDLTALVPPSWGARWSQ